MNKLAKRKRVTFEEQNKPFDLLAYTEFRSQDLPSPMIQPPWYEPLSEQEDNEPNQLWQYFYPEVERVRTLVLDDKTGRPYFAWKYPPAFKPSRVDRFRELLLLEVWLWQNDLNLGRYHMFMDCLYTRLKLDPRTLLFLNDDAILKYYTEWNALVCEEELTEDD